MIRMAGHGRRGDRGAYMVVAEDAVLRASLVIEDNASFETGKPVYLDTGLVISDL